MGIVVSQLHDDKGCDADAAAAKLSVCLDHLFIRLVALSHKEEITKILVKS